MRPARFCQLRNLLTTISLFLVAGPIPASAQGLASATVAGDVRDVTGLVLFDASVSVIEDESGLRRTVQSDRNGRFLVVLLTAGNYTAVVERLGYVPVEVRGIEVRPGDQTTLSIVLRPASGPVAARDVIQAGSSSSLAAGPPMHWTAARGASALPFEAWSLSMLGALSSRFGPDLGADGLPGTMTELVLDGVPSMIRVSRLGRYVRDAAHPFVALAGARTLPTVVDPEWPGSAGGHVSGYTRVGGRTVGGRLDAEWAGDAIAGGDGVAGFNSMRAAARLSGPIVPDTAHFMAGIEYLRSELPFAQPWTSDDATAALLTAIPDGVAAPRGSAPAISVFERIAGFGRTDLQLGREHEVSVGFDFAALPSVAPITVSEGWLVPEGAQADAWNLHAMARLTSRFSDEMTNEIDARLELGHIGWTADDGDGAAAPLTSVVSANRTFGSADARDAAEDVLGIYFRESVYLRSGDHDLKFGLAVDLPNYEVDTEPYARGRFVFSDPDDLIARRGVVERVETDFAPPADIGFRRFAFYGNDRWRPAPGLDLDAGLRVSVTRMPDTAKLGANEDWQRLADISNQAIPERIMAAEPRFSVRWDPTLTGAWVIEGYAQVDAGFIDPAIVAEVFANDGGRFVTRATGDLGMWPEPPLPAVVQNTGSALSLLGPNFRSPESSRAGASISWQSGGPTVTLAFDARRTEFLPQRRDINLIGGPATHDQNGRPVYGELVKIGSVLAAQPFSNRRFVEFDNVWVMEATGSSTYRGFTLTVEQSASAGFGLFGSYTYSSTRDDWLAPTALDPHAQISPFPDSLNGIDWREGRSDYDVPHRLTVGAELIGPGTLAPRIAAIYRFQSGTPFTPGLVDGIDVNADGSARNDPAFVDSGLEGMSAMISDWPCLADFDGAFVERNACRGPNINALDARFSLTLLNDARYSAELVADALNLVASDWGVVDRALLSVDPDTPLVVDPGSVTIPYVVNPTFGELRTKFSPQRVFRIGLRVRY